jgi:hypothetical protein
VRLVEKITRGSVTIAVAAWLVLIGGCGGVGGPSDSGAGRGDGGDARSDSPADESAPTDRPEEDANGSDLPAADTAAIDDGPAPETQATDAGADLVPDGGDAGDGGMEAGDGGIDGADGGIDGPDGGTDAGDGSSRCATPQANAIWGVLREPEAVTSVFALAPDDVWSAHTANPTEGGGGGVGPMLNQITHWNGTAWSPVLSDSSGFSGVWASSKTDVWAAGNGLRRFNGTTWNDVTPFPVPGDNRVTLVWGLSRNDVWAQRVGTQPRLAHWDGSSWADRSPPLASNDTGPGPRPVAAVWGASPTDVWAATSTTAPSPSGICCLPSITMAHWDGAGWTLYSTGVGARVNALWGSSTHDIWAVGAELGVENAVAIHFDGVSWTRAPSASVPGGLQGVWGTCANNVWAVGFNGAGFSQLQHFDGTSWSVVGFSGTPEQGFPNPAGWEIFPFNAISGSTADDFWIAGTPIAAPQQSSLIHHHL